MEEEKISSKRLSITLKLTLLVLLSLFLLSLIVSEIIEIKDKLKIKEKITISGEGKATGIPDVASVNLSVVTEKMTAKEAIKENASKMNEIVKFVKEAGIEEKDIATQSYYLSPLYDWVKEERIFKGYQVISTLAVKIRNLDKISEIIDGAVLRGANQIENIKFVIDNPEKLKEEARNKAIENAKEKSESVAKATGIKLGKIISFSETVIPEVYPYPYSMETKELGGGEEAPTVEKGSQEIKVNVSLTFEVN